MILHTDSHTDHGLTLTQVNHLLGLFADRTGFFIETVTLPEALGTVPCGLYGPKMGDKPLTDLQSAVQVVPGYRGDRKYTSRLVRLPTRPVREVTVIAGPHDGAPCVLYTAFGGPLTPKEPGELERILATTNPEPGAEGRGKLTAQLEESRAFWAEHALVMPEDCTCGPMNPLGDRDPEAERYCPEHGTED